jgi:hypothetical protein
MVDVGPVAGERDEDVPELVRILTSRPVLIRAGQRGDEGRTGSGLAVELVGEAVVAVFAQAGVDRGDP